MSEETKLQTNYEELEARITALKANKTAVDVELGSVISRLVDAKESKRPELITRRAELRDQAGIFMDELGELQRRRDAAYLAIFEYRENVAKTEFDRCIRVGSEARRAMEAAIETHRRGLGGHRAQTEEDIRKMAQLESEKSKAIAESQICTRNTERARREYEDARDQTAEVKKQLGI